MVLSEYQCVSDVSTVGGKMEQCRYSRYSGGVGVMPMYRTSILRDVSVTVKTSP